MIKIRESCDMAMIKSLNFTIQSQIISVISQQAIKYEQSMVQNNYMQIFRDFLDIIQKKIPSWFGTSVPSPEVDNLQQNSSTSSFIQFSTLEPQKIMEIIKKEDIIKIERIIYLKQDCCLQILYYFKQLIIILINTKGIECISLMLEEGEKVFKGNCELENIIQNDLISLLDKLLAQSSVTKDEALYIKVLKLETKIVGLVHNKYNIFLKFNLKDEKKFSKIKYSALESYLSIFSKLESFQKFVESTYKQNNQQSQFIEFLRDLTGVTKDLFGGLTVAKKRRQKSYAESVGADLDGIVEYNGNDFLLLCLQLINAITNNLIQMCTTLSGVNLTSYKKFDKHYKFNYDEENFRTFFEDIYRHLYNILKMIFCAINDTNMPLDQQSAQLFVNIRNCLFLSLFLNKQKAFAQFFKLVCQQVLTKHQYIDQKFKFNTQIFFYIYDHFTSSLSVNCWESLIHYLHHYEERKEGKLQLTHQKTTNTHQTNQTHQTEMHTKHNQTEGDDSESQINLYIEKVKNFFKNTQNLRSQQLNSLITALENSTYDMLEDHEAMVKSRNQSINTKQEPGSTPQILSPTTQQAFNMNVMKRFYDETFTLTKMLEVVQCNKQRIHLIWKSISSILITISTCKEQEFRIKATTILGQILLEVNQFYATGNTIFQKDSSNCNSLKSIESPLPKSPLLAEKEVEILPFSTQEIQGILFGVWETLSLCQFAEVKQIISEQMEQMIQVLGTSLNQKGRLSLLKVLVNFSDQQQNEKYIESN